MTQLENNGNQTCETCSSWVTEEYIIKKEDVPSCWHGDNIQAELQQTFDFLQNSKRKRNHREIAEFMHLTNSENAKQIISTLANLPKELLDWD